MIGTQHLFQFKSHYLFINQQKMHQGGHFTMDFIEEQYRDSVKMIMEILCVDIKTAYDLFIMAGCNVEAAIHLHTNPQPEHQHFSNNEPSFSRPNINPPQRNRRNGVIRNYHDFNQQLQQLSNHFDQNFEQDEYPSFPMARRRPLPLRVDQESQFDMKFNRFLQFKRKKKSFAKNYKIKRQALSEQSMSIGRKIFNKKPNKPSSKQFLQLKPFINEIQDQVLQRRCHIRFDKGSMSQSLELSFDKKKPLLVFHLNFQLNKNDEKNESGSKRSIAMSQATTRNRKKKMIIDLQSDDACQKSVSLQQIPPSKHIKKTANNNRNPQTKTNNKNNQLFKTLLLDTKTVRLVNESFQNYIVDCENYNYQSYFREYFCEQNKRRNFLLILRVNVLEEIQQVGRVDLDQLLSNLDQQQKQEKKQPQQQRSSQTLIKKIIQKLKHLLQRIKSIQKQQLQIHQRYRLLQMGIDHFEYVKPPTTAEKIKIKQDRQLIRQQQEQFMNIQNDMLQQQLKEELEKESAQNNFEKISKEDLLKKRQQIRESLNKYDQTSIKNNNEKIMMIKFRLPNGKNIILNVSKNQKVSYLYDYIQSLDMENIGFEQQQQQGGYCDRKFDIIRPQDRLNLNQKKDVLLEELFDGSLMESLNVKEQ